MRAPVLRPKWIERYTPNLSPRRKGVRLIILHHTGGSLPGCLRWLTSVRSKVSADFLISRGGLIYKLNQQLNLYYTWHAGRSLWKRLGEVFRGVNKISFGIEMEHVPGEPWPDRQVSAAAHLCAWMIDRYPDDALELPQHPIQSHRAVAYPRGRKTDPENFPWARFGAQVRKLLGTEVSR